MTQDRLAERRFVEAPGSRSRRGARSRPTEALRGGRCGARHAAPAQGRDRRLRRPQPGPRSPRPTTSRRRSDAPRPPGRAGRCSRSASSTFEAELSVVVARGIDGGPRPSRSRGTCTTTGSSSSPSCPRRSAGRSPRRRRRRSRATSPTAMGLVGTLTVELFLMRDGSLVVNELAPRVHNSGHWTIEGAATSPVRAAHPRDLRPAARLDRDALAPTADGQRPRAGPAAPARLPGVDEALADPAVHLHLYDKREVFERRKMGHVTALGATLDEALDRRAAPAALAWACRRRPTDGRDGDDARRAPAAAVVGIVGGSRSDFPVLERRRRRPRRARRPVRAAGRLGPSHPRTTCSATPRRRPARGHPGDHRGRRRSRPPAGHARRQDGAAGHRRAHPDPAPRRARLAAVDRPDAARHPGRDRGHRQRRRTPGCSRPRSSPCPTRRSDSAWPPGANDRLPTSSTTRPTPNRFFWTPTRPTLPRCVARRARSGSAARSTSSIAARDPQADVAPDELADEEHAGGRRRPRSGGRRARRSGRRAERRRAPRGCGRGAGRPRARGRARGHGPARRERPRPADDAEVRPAHPAVAHQRRRGSGASWRRSARPARARCPRPRC